MRFLRYVGATRKFELPFPCLVVTVGVCGSSYCAPHGRIYERGVSMVQIKLILCLSNKSRRCKRIKLHAPTALSRKIPRCYDCTGDWAFLTVCLETLVTNIQNLSWQFVWRHWWQTNKIFPHSCFVTNIQHLFSFGNTTNIDLGVN